MKALLVLCLLLLPTSLQAGKCRDKLRACSPGETTIPYKSWKGKVTQLLKGRNATFTTKADRKKVAVAMEQALNAFQQGQHHKTIALLQNCSVKIHFAAPHILAGPEAIPDTFEKWINLTYGDSTCCAMRVAKTVLVVVSDVKMRDPTSGQLRSLKPEDPKERQALEWMARQRLEEYWHALQFFSEDRPLTVAGVEFEKWSLNDPEFGAWQQKEGRQAVPTLLDPVSDAEWSTLDQVERELRQKSWREAALVEADIAALFLLLGAHSDGIQHPESSPLHARVFLRRMLKENGRNTTR